MTLHQGAVQSYLPEIRRLLKEHDQVNSSARLFVIRAEDSVTFELQVSALFVQIAVSRKR
jgi:hypothetical protein